ncbi:uncharacterized protein LOC110875815 [Helianthus annuus]|uniref:uncharacterized protein LOC110875815 n=1 Tax=Helianthus annuus TaxID=4232 RepID=UPI000B8FD463|nr:uncharacterized protein LOC110875815 [Helianthus annuus]
MEGLNVRAYTSQFNDLARLVPQMVTPDYVKIQRYIWGQAPQIRGMVTSAKPATYLEATNLEKSLADDDARKSSLNKKDETRKSLGKANVDGKSDRSERSEPRSRDSRKRKSESSKKDSDEKREKKRAYGDEQGKCARCGRSGHVTRECYAKSTLKGVKLEGCYECREQGHYKRNCLNVKGQNARGKAFELNNGKARDDPAVVTGTFLINNHSVFVLFNTWADLSFVSKKFEPFPCFQTSKLGKKYSIELANGKLIETSEVIRDCSFRLCDHSFSIDLLLVEVGSFDVVVGMDWLSKNKAEIICSEKQVRIPRLGSEAIVVHGDRSSRVSRIVSVMKMHKMLHKGYPMFLINVVDTKVEGRKIEESPIVREYPEVFPEDLPRLPRAREIEFRIDLVPGVAPIAKSPYRLASSEMKELSNQLQELLDKGKANVVADALSRKEREKPLRVRALGLIIQMSLTVQIRDA